MTDEMLSDEDAMMAAEYALGLLEGDELAVARSRTREDANFARAVANWEVRLASMTDELAPVTPSAATKEALMSTLFPEPAAPAATAAKGFWSGLRIWQGISGISVAALAAVVFLGITDPAPEPGPVYSAEIVSAEGDFRVVALIDKTEDQIILTRLQGEAPEGRILQVWGHGEDEPTISVGLWPEGTTVRLPMPPDIAAVEGILTIGVSEEPPGGSATGLPSGRIFGTVDIPGIVDPA